MVVSKLQITIKNPNLLMIWDLWLPRDNKQKSPGDNSRAFLIRII